MAHHAEYWRQRAKQHILDRGLTLDEVCSRYINLARLRGFRRTSKDGQTSAHSLTPGALSHWLNGRREPRMSEFLLLCDAMETTPEVMFAGMVAARPTLGTEDIERVAAAVAAKVKSKRKAAKKPVKARARSVV